MPVTDAVLYVHGTGTSAYGPISLAAGVYGDAICAAGSQYSNLELDFGSGVGGGTVGFPSYTEKGYTFPPEVVGSTSVQMGLHIQVCQVFNTLTSINFQVCTSSATAALVGSAPNPIAARTLTLAQLAIAGAHYFIPVNFASMLEFNRFYAAITGSNPTTGTIVAWFGPQTGGEQ
jgi:hypothetical protein